MMMMDVGLGTIMDSMMIMGIDTNGCRSGHGGGLGTMGSQSCHGCWIQVDVGVESNGSLHTSLKIG